jgi:hypothetical protein
MTDWEQHYLEGHTPWNKGQPSPPMLEWVTSNKPTGRALVPGCGVGHDVAMLARNGLEAYGLDIAPTRSYRTVSCSQISLIRQRASSAALISSSNTPAYAPCRRSGGFVMKKPPTNC